MIVHLNHSLAPWFKQYLAFAHIFQVELNCFFELFKLEFFGHHTLHVLGNVGSNFVEYLKKTQLILCLQPLGQHESIYDFVAKHHITDIDVT